VGIGGGVPVLVGMVVGMVVGPDTGHLGGADDEGG
jgi:hypothetical protein